MGNLRLYLAWLYLTYQFRQVLVSISCSVKSIGNVINVDQLTVKSIYNLCINFIIKRLGKLAKTGDSAVRRRGKGARLSQVLNVAMANDALKPKTKQLPKSFCRGEGRGGLAAWLFGLLGRLGRLARLAGWLNPLGHKSYKCSITGSKYAHLMHNLA